MPTVEEEIQKLKREGVVFERRVKRWAFGYIAAAFGLVAGLAWNEAIKALIEYFFPLSTETVWAKFIYAGAVTIAAAFFAGTLMRGEGGPVIHPSQLDEEGFENRRMSPQKGGRAG